MLQEQPNEKDAPQASGFSPWHAHVLLNDREKVICYDMDVVKMSIKRLDDVE